MTTSGRPRRSRTSRQRGQPLGHGMARPVRRDRRHRLGREREAGRAPRAGAAVEQPQRGMAEVVEEPEHARGPDVGGVAVDEHGAIVGYPAESEHVLDHPEERRERRRIGVDQAEAPQVQVHGAGQVAGGERLGGAHVEDERRVVAGRRTLGWTRNESGIVTPPLILLPRRRRRPCGPPRRFGAPALRPRASAGGRARRPRPTRSIVAGEVLVDPPGNRGGRARRRRPAPRRPAVRAGAGAAGRTARVRPDARSPGPCAGNARVGASATIRSSDRR